MFLKVASLVVILQVVAIWGDQQKYMIKNKKSGSVLDGAQQKVEIGAWQNKDSQLWTVESSGTPGYSILRNVANGNALDACPYTKVLLMWTKHGGTNQRWKLNTQGDERLQVQYYPNDFMMHKNQKPMLDVSKQSDESDMWSLVEQQKVEVV